LKGYLERFNERYAELILPEEIRIYKCDRGSYELPVMPELAVAENRNIGDIEQLQLTIPIKTYAASWRIEEAPEPEHLAHFLNEFLISLCCGVNREAGRWYKREGIQVMEGLSCDFSNSPDIGKVQYDLVIRMPWEVTIERKWESLQNYVLVYGRFGLAPKE
jgi:hypothetical protein